MSGVLIAAAALIIVTLIGVIVAVSMLISAAWVQYTTAVERREAARARNRFHARMQARLEDER